MNRTIKVATVQRYHYESHAQFEAHLAAVLDAYNFAKRLKTFSGLQSSGSGGLRPRPLIAPRELRCSELETVSRVQRHQTGKDLIDTGFHLGSWSDCTFARR
jgi:hypothetical protein